MEHVRAPKEVVDEASLRSLVHFSRRAHLLDAAARHDRDAVGECEGLFLVVRDEDGSEAGGIVQFAQPAAHLDTDLGIERPEWFVEQQQLRLGRERPRQCDPLTLPARELPRKARTHALELYELEQLFDARSDLAPRRPGFAAAAPAGRRRCC